MRTILMLCVLTLAGGGFFGWRAMRTPARYGEFTGAPQVAVADLIGRPKDFLGKPVAVEGSVRQQCETMGCFFFLSAGKSLLRVDLQEIAMTAPRKEGHAARVEGQIVPHGDGYQLFASAVEFE